ncbi:hypothetical protein HPB47_008297 [Ixodes persulcatus]|uniref:Uncharacterized protein n=1 Tax=Ixodes persulcatus TaxID=34615 RepID=A0AC60P555_IXOPE|nr:hypothetical protein HPB47_008297 [Ixodes persulcatus]
MAPTAPVVCYRGACFGEERVWEGGGKSARGDRCEGRRVGWWPAPETPSQKSSGNRGGGLQPTTGRTAAGGADTPLAHTPAGSTGLSRCCCVPPSQFGPRGDASVTCLGGRLRRDGGPQQSRRPSAFRGAHSREISGPDSPESRSRSGDDDDGAGSAERGHYRGRPGLPSPMVAATTKAPPPPRVGGQRPVTVRQQRAASPLGDAAPRSHCSRDSVHERADSGARRATRRLDQSRSESDPLRVSGQALPGATREQRGQSQRRPRFTAAARGIEWLATDGGSSWFIRHASPLRPPSYAT